MADIAKNQPSPGARDLLDELGVDPEPLRRSLRPLL
jgi:hypothetical protein